MKFKNGITYDGGWKYDYKHGEGVLKDKNGKIIRKGKWINGMFEGDYLEMQRLYGHHQFSEDTDQISLKEVDIFADLRKRPSRRRGYISNLKDADMNSKSRNL